MQTLVTICGGVLLAWLDLAWTTLLILMPVQVWLITAVINTSMHHHTHWFVFRNKILNSIYEIVLSAATGISAQHYRWAHMRHHRFVNDRPVDGVCKDPVSVWLSGKKGQPENVWIFSWKFVCPMLAKPYLYFFMPQMYRKRYTQYLVNTIQERNEYLASVIYTALLLFLNFKYAAWYLFIVLPVSHVLMMVWNYGEHWRALHLREDNTRNSISVYNAWYNGLCFNSGYHQEHHHKPLTHWTKLPEITASLPSDRPIAKGMHIFNVPWWQHLKDLFRPQRSQPE